MKIFGYYKYDSNFWPVNFILITVFIGALNKKKIEDMSMQKLIKKKKKHDEEKLLSKKNGHSEIFFKKMAQLEKLYT